MTISPDDKMDADHCESIGFRGVTEKFVKENPFLMALAYGQFCEIDHA